MGRVNSKSGDIQIQEFVAFLLADSFPACNYIAPYKMAEKNLLDSF